MLCFQILLKPYFLKNKAVQLNYSNQYENCSKSNSSKFRIRASASKLLLWVSRSDMLQQRKRQIKFPTFLEWQGGERETEKGHPYMTI